MPPPRCGRCPTGRRRPGARHRWRVSRRQRSPRGCGPWGGQRRRERPRARPLATRTPGRPGAARSASSPGGPGPPRHSRPRTRGRPPPNRPCACRRRPLPAPPVAPAARGARAPPARLPPGPAAPCPPCPAPPEPRRPPARGGVGGAGLSAGLVKPEGAAALEQERRGGQGGRPPTPGREAGRRIAGPEGSAVRGGAGRVARRGRGERRPPPSPWVRTSEPPSAGAPMRARCAR